MVMTRDTPAKQTPRRLKQRKGYLHKVNESIWFFSALQRVRGKELITT